MRLVADDPSTGVHLWPKPAPKPAWTTLHGHDISIAVHGRGDFPMNKCTSLNNVVYEVSLCICFSSPCVLHRQCEVWEHGNVAGFYTWLACCCVTYYTWCLDPETTWLALVFYKLIEQLISACIAVNSAVASRHSGRQCTTNLPMRLWVKRRTVEDSALRMHPSSSTERTIGSILESW